MTKEEDGGVMGERAGWRKGMAREWWAELIGDAPRHLWIPAFAGMTKGKVGMTKEEGWGMMEEKMGWRRKGRDDGRGWRE